MKTSLHAFCRYNDLPKTSVYRKCQELHIPTSDGLSLEDCDRVLVALGKKEAPQAEPAIETTVVETGNHQITVAPVQLPQVFSLESLRTTESVQIEDPLTAATQFLAVADQLTTAMQADIQSRQAKLNQTQQAKDAIAAKKQQLELEARIYQLETSRLDTAQTATTQQLQDSLASLQRLGKPPTDGDGSQQS